MEANQIQGKSVDMHLCKLVAHHSFHNMNIYYPYDQQEVCEIILPFDVMVKELPSYLINRLKLTSCGSIPASSKFQD